MVSTGSKIVLRVLGAAVIAAVALLIGADVIARGGAAGHVRLHALVALVVAAPAVALAWRGAPAGFTSAPALGLLTLTLAQLVEGVGGAGFDANNDTRNGLAVIHDLGLALTPIGLLAAVTGIAIGVWAGARRRFRAPVAVLVVGAIVLIGLLGIKTLIGI